MDDMPNQGMPGGVTPPPATDQPVAPATDQPVEPVTTPTPTDQPTAGVDNVTLPGEAPAQPAVPPTV